MNERDIRYKRQAIFFLKKLIEARKWKDEALGLAYEVLACTGYRDDIGGWDSCANSSAAYAMSILVENGLARYSREGYGRRQFIRFEENRL